ncbi:MAG TPA: serine hydrolase domain-containing protein [Rectinemataceae bacterium]|nr:serine hydrolase domain-containing protein [Rectinemataceae bacterium]
MKLFKRILPFAIVVAAALLILNLPDLVPARYTDLGAFFSTERHRQGLIGLTVASVKYGAPDFVGAWGADARGIPLESFTPMAVGKLSRAVTGIMAARLEAKGKIDLDQSASSLIPELKGGRVSTAAVTLRQFLRQTSGLSALTFDDRHSLAKSLAAAMPILAAAKPLAAPGEKIMPIETGYEAVGLALERATKSGFAKLADKEVFGPLGMKQSEADGEAASDRLPQGATQFFWTAFPKFEDLSPSRVPAVGVVSTAPDFARLMAALVNPGFGGVNILGRGDEREPRPLDADSGMDWGWRVIPGSKDGELRIESSGMAFSAIAGLWPERQAGMVILVPTSGLLVSKLVLPALLEGAHTILLADNAEPPPPFGRLAILFGIIAAIHVLALAASTGSAMSWARGVKGRGEAKGSENPVILARIRCFSGILARLLIVLLMPIISGYLLGSRIDWGWMFEWEPGLTGWLAVAIVIGLLRNIARLSWLRSPSSQIRKMQMLLKR